MTTEITPRSGLSHLAATCPICIAGSPAAGAELATAAVIAAAAAQEAADGTYWRTDNTGAEYRLALYSGSFVRVYRADQPI